MTKLSHHIGHCIFIQVQMKIMTLRNSPQGHPTIKRTLWVKGNHRYVIIADLSKENSTLNHKI